MQLRVTISSLLLDLFLFAQAVLFALFVRSGSENVVVVKGFWLLATATLLLGSEIGTDIWVAEVRKRVHAVGRRAFYGVGLACIAITMFINPDMLVGALVILYGAVLAILAISILKKTIHGITG